MMKRRSFIKRSGLATASLLMPNFLSAFEQPINLYQGKKLIVVQLSGGCDGLSAVVPYRNDIYYSSRKTLGIERKDCFSLTDEMGLNPAMKGLKELYDDGFLNIINQVGYPNANRSHFRSMDIWHTASASHEYWSTGWLGRFLDNTCDTNCDAHTALEMDEALSLALKGNHQNGMATTNIKHLHKSIQSGGIKSLSEIYQQNNHDAGLNYLYKTLANTTSSIDYLKEKSKIFKSKRTYPNNSFGNRLKTISELICSGSNTSVYYVSLTGFDTHANQKGPLNRLLKQLSDGLKTMVDDLKENNQFNDCTIMVFSEFGRRVKENGSGGTDHGVGNNLYLISNQLKKPGLFNEPTDLSNLDEGDIMHKIDFRSIYADILSNWLKVDDTKILKNSYNTLNLFKS